MTEAAWTAAEAVARESYGKLVALLAAGTGDIAAAEDALGDAFAAALVAWPAGGCPERPEAWLLTVARRRLIDRARRRRRAEAAGDVLARLAESAGGGEAAIPDRRLGLLFACADPAIDPGIRAPLMLQVVLGLDAAAVGSAFLTSPAAMAKRLVRAKERIRRAALPLRVPEPEELAPRVDAVLDAVYAAYTAGWSDPGGADLARRELRGEAVFLARLVADLLPESAEALGLLALILHAEARRPARRDPSGEYVPLAEQDPAAWDWPLIVEAEGLLHRASGLRVLGRYQLEAAIQSAHVHRRRTGEDNWAEVVRLYDALLGVAVSPVVAINRALAIAETEGATAGLAAMPDGGRDRRLADYQPYWAARAELLARTGAGAAAAEAYRLAIGLERDAAVRRFLQRRAGLSR